VQASAAKRVTYLTDFRQVFHVDFMGASGPLEGCVGLLAHQRMWASSPNRATLEVERFFSDDIRHVVAAPLSERDNSFSVTSSKKRASVRQSAQAQRVTDERRQSAGFNHSGNNTECPEGAWLPQNENLRGTGSAKQPRLESQNFSHRYLSKIRSTLQ
jgi:hypothetical protein